MISDDNKFKPFSFILFQTPLKDISIQTSVISPETEQPPTHTEQPPTPTEQPPTPTEQPPTYTNEPVVKQKKRRNQYV